jgi:hypothetical protein
MGGLKLEVKNYILSRYDNIQKAIHDVKGREVINKVKEPEVIKDLKIRLSEVKNMAANFGIKLK